MSSEVDLHDRLRKIAKEIESEATIASRPGQMDRLDALATSIREIAAMIRFRASELRGEGKDGDQ